MTGISLKYPKCSGAHTQHTHTHKSRNIHTLKDTGDGIRFMSCQVNVYREYDGSV